MAAGRPRLGFSTVASTRPSRSSRPRWRRTPTELILSRSARRGADRRPWRRNSTRICSRVLGTRSAVDMGLLLPCTLWKQQCFLGIVYAGGGRESKLATLAPPGGTGMAEPLFRGVGVALATLFDGAGGLDAKATAEHAATLVDLGVRAVVVAGPTGEAAPLTPAERPVRHPGAGRHRRAGTPAGGGADPGGRRPRRRRPAGAVAARLQRPAWLLRGGRRRGRVDAGARLPLPEVVAAWHPGRAAAGAAHPGGQGLQRRPGAAARRAGRLRRLAVRRRLLDPHDGRRARLHRRDPGGGQRGAGAREGGLRRQRRRAAGAVRRPRGRPARLPPRAEAADGRALRHLHRRAARLTLGRLVLRSSRQAGGLYGIGMLAV